MIVLAQLEELRLKYVLLLMFLTLAKGPGQGGNGTGTGLPGGGNVLELMRLEQDYQRR